MLYQLFKLNFLNFPEEVIWYGSLFHTKSENFNTFIYRM